MHAKGMCEVAGMIRIEFPKLWLMQAPKAGGNRGKEPADAIRYSYGVQEGIEVKFARQLSVAFLFFFFLIEREGSGGEGGGALYQVRPPELGTGCSTRCVLATWKG